MKASTINLVSTWKDVTGRNDLNITCLQKYWPKSGLLVVCHQALANGRKEIDVRANVDTMYRLCQAIRNGDTSAIAALSIGDWTLTALGWKNNGEDLPFDLQNVDISTRNHQPLANRICQLVWDQTRALRDTTNVFSHPAHLRIGTYGNVPVQILYECVRTYAREYQFCEVDGYKMLGTAVVNGDAFLPAENLTLRLCLRFQNVTWQKFYSEKEDKTNVQFDIEISPVVVVIPK